MRIVVLDGYTLNPGDLSWESLTALGPCDIYDRSSPEEVLARAHDAEIVLTNKVQLSREVIAQLPRLRYVGVLATGYNCVDVAAARERNIVVTNVPTYGTASVSQMVLAHMLNFTQRVAHHAQTVAEERWTTSADWCYWDFPLIELADRTMGIVGFGRIGQEVAQVARALRMRVLASDARPIEPADGITGADVDTVFRQSDVVSLHCPLTPQTRHLVDRRRLGLMKRSAFLINTSRGPLIDDEALADALNAGQIAGAGLDVLSEEPPPAGNPLLRAQNCWITPHIAWATGSARARLLAIAVDNVRSFLEGRTRNVVNSGQ
jgi:glycerate dehydrogenase